jgi:hypothetical protein
MEATNHNADLPADALLKPGETFRGTVALRASAT